MNLHALYRVCLVGTNILVLRTKLRDAFDVRIIVLRSFFSNNLLTQSVEFS